MPNTRKVSQTWGDFTEFWPRQNLKTIWESDDGNRVNSQEVG